MLDHDLARLAAAGPELSLASLEQAIWRRVDGLKRWRRLERAVSRVQMALLGGALIAGMAIGAVAAKPPMNRQAVVQISSVAADLAPSTLLGIDP